MLLSTHIIEDVQSVCDQIVVIHHGTILFTGTPEQLIQSAAGHVGVFWEKDETLEQGLHITARVNTSQGIRCRAVADKLPPYCPGGGALFGGRLPLSDLQGGGTMKTMRLFPLELKRLLQSRLTWLMMALAVLSPALGAGTLQTRHIHHHALHVFGKPRDCGGVAGAILFGLLTIFELDRACRSRVDILTDAVGVPSDHGPDRLLALLMAAVLTVGLTMLVWLPISVGLIGAVFTGANYVLAYLLFMGLALPLGILAAAAAYQFTRRGGSVHRPVYRPSAP